MSNKGSRLSAVFAIAVVTILAMPVEATWKKHGADADVILEWDQILQANIPATAALFSFRYYAMMHIAMFDAANSIEQKYRAYHVRVRASSSASAEAAAAQAAHDVLVGLIPGDAARAAFDAALASHLEKIHWWRAAEGVEVGKKVARAVLEWRADDGSQQPNTAYLPPALPGLWQPTAPGQVAAFAHFGSVEPFGLLTPTQFLPDPPPLLNSDEYTTDFNDVKAIGATGSTDRSAEQTQLALLFAASGYGPSPFALWATVARDVVGSRDLSLIDTARTFVLLNVSMNDGLQTSHTSKFIYGLWRPVTAIQRAGEDLNDGTLADPSWAPLLGTPPYPSHSSNLMCIGVSAARALARALRTDEVSFSVTWTGTGGNADVTRSYTHLSQLAAEGGISRVYGGIHFLFEITDSAESCTKVADYVYDNYMRRKR